MGNVGFHKLKALALELRDAYDIKYFIETGTYKAETAIWAAGEFDQIVSIEAYEKHYNGCLANLKHLTNATWVLGNSGHELGKYLPDEPAIVWLDAHWCGNYEMSAGTWGECPILDELDHLTMSDVNHFVLIDDARLFLNPPPMEHDPIQWPSFDEIQRELTKVHKKTITVWNDAIIAVPDRAAEFLQVLA